VIRYHYHSGADSTLPRSDKNCVPTIAAKTPALAQIAFAAAAASERDPSTSQF
jgi:hypothetical protein